MAIGQREKQLLASTRKGASFQNDKLCSEVEAICRRELKSSACQLHSHFESLSTSQIIKMLAFFELLVIYASLALAQNTGQQTITALAAYSSLRACAQDCIWQSGLGCETDVLGATIGCANGDACFTPTVAAYNSCYCRADMQNTAMSYLSTCISNSCTEGAYTIDLSAAVSLYGGYCTAEGYTSVLAEATPANGLSATGYVSQALGEPINSIVSHYKLLTNHVPRATATGTSSSGGNTVSQNGGSGNQGGNSDQQCGTGANNSGTIECGKNGSSWSRTDFATLGAALAVTVLIISVVTICA